MKFGKLQSLEGVDFSLPPDREEALLGLKKEGNTEPFQAFIGCPMWGNKGWVGKLYPKGTKAGKFLFHYSRAFNTIEMNTTHYRSPSEEQIRKWKDQVPTSFVFCPKIPQTISHYGKLQNVSAQTTAFCNAISLFEENLGCAFMQMHESFGPDKLQVLAEFLSNFTPDIPLAIEFRHEGWFQDHLLIPQLSELLYHFRVSAVITDVAGRRDVLHTSMTSDIAMIRFVGNGLVPSDYQRVDTWVERLKMWRDRGLKDVYFFVHEPDDTFAPEMGTYVIEQLNAHLNLSIPLPSMVENSGTQMRLF
ncbi:MAG: DUF72 domain-containing protein [Bacteroidota bacterium]